MGKKISCGLGDKQKCEPFIQKSCKKWMWLEHHVTLFEIFFVEDRRCDLLGFLASSKELCAYVDTAELLFVIFVDQGQLNSSKRWVNFMPC